MKKQLGIIRSRTDRFISFKKETQRKKNRFHIVGKENKEEDDISNTTFIQLFRLTQITQSKPINPIFYNLD